MTLEKARIKVDKAVAGSGFESDDWKVGIDNTTIGFQLVKFLGFRNGMPRMEIHEFRFCSDWSEDRFDEWLDEQIDFINGGR